MPAWLFVMYVCFTMCVLYVAIAEGPPAADDDDDSVTDNFGAEHELFGNCTETV